MNTFKTLIMSSMILQASCALASDGQAQRPSTWDKGVAFVKQNALPTIAGVVVGTAGMALIFGPQHRRMSENNRQLVADNEKLQREQQGEERVARESKRQQGQPQQFVPREPGQIAGRGCGRVWSRKALDELPVWGADNGDGGPGILSDRKEGDATELQERLAVEQAANAHHLREKRAWSLRREEMEQHIGTARTAYRRAVTKAHEIGYSRSDFKDKGKVKGSDFTVIMGYCGGMMDSIGRIEGELTRSFAAKKSEQ